ncbi:hypothetical protein F4780DRAFT_102827 [Xylariomycetidae sp. FL0641]|nr:hypothetical protein F4780DRAFT_102827 [Xylariomycetidae sp. FL0641]
MNVDEERNIRRCRRTWVCLLGTVAERPCLQRRVSFSFSLSLVCLLLLLLLATAGLPVRRLPLASSSPSLRPIFPDLPTYRYLPPVPCRARAALPAQPCPTLPCPRPRKRYARPSCLIARRHRLGSLRSLARLPAESSTSSDGWMDGRTDACLSARKIFALAGSGG